MFQCNKCGECCRNLDKSDLYRELDRGDGTCIYLKDDLCSVYTSRPLLCRVDECYDIFFKSIMTKDEYELKNYEQCKLLIIQKQKDSVK